MAGRRLLVECRRSETCSSPADFAVACSCVMVRRAVQAKHTGSCACLRPAAVQRLRGGGPGWPRRFGRGTKTRQEAASVGHANPWRLHSPTKLRPARMAASRWASGGDAAGGGVRRPCKPLAFASADQASAGQDGRRSALHSNAARCGVQSAMQTLGVCIGRQASAGQDGRSVGREPETPHDAASSRPCKPSAFASADKLRRARMAAEALKPDVRAWASEGGSLAQATEHPSGLLRGRDHHRDLLKMRNAKCVPDMRCPAQSSSSSLPEPGKFPRKTWFSTPVGKQKHFGLPGPSRQNRAECVHWLPREWAGRGRWPRMAVGLPGRQNVTIFGGAASVSSPAGPSACRATSSSSRDARWPWCGTPARSRKFASSRKPCRVRIDSG